MSSGSWLLQLGFKQLEACRDRIARIKVQRAQPGTLLPAAGQPHTQPAPRQVGVLW